MDQGAACLPVAQAQGDTLNQITKVRLANGKQIAIVDWSWRPLYSLVQTLSGWTDQELRLFSYGLGDPVLWTQNLITATAARRNALLDETNISTGGQMGSVQEALVYAITCEFFQETFTDQGDVFSVAAAGEPLPVGRDIALLHRFTILELEVAEKAYQQAPPSWFGAGGGVVVSTDVAGTRSYGNNGTPDKRAIDMFPVPVHIAPTNAYAVILHNPQGVALTYRTDAGNEAATRVIDMRVSLVGLHKRPAG